MNEQERELRALIGRLANGDASGVGIEDDLVRELGFDSLTGLRILAAVEQHFDVRFPDDKLSDLRTIKSIMGFIKER